MRCPECNATHQRRSGMKCRCGYQFVLTRQDDNITDYALCRLVEQVSAHDQHHFTQRQLATAICRFWHKKASQVVGSVIGCAIIAAIAWFFLGWNVVTGITVMTIVVIVSWLFFRRREPQLDFQKARQLIQRYDKSHPLERMVKKRVFQGNGDKVDDEDIFYAPTQMLIVEQDEMVDLLVLNRFHLTTRTAIVSENGYPEHIFAACEKFLETEPDMGVYAAHDISKSGASWVARLKEAPRWQKFCERIVDLGPDPAEFKRSKPLLPWLRGKHLYFSRNAEKHLNAGGRMALDSVPPHQMLLMLSGAVAAGAFIIAASAAHAAASGDAFFEFSFDSDDFG